MEHAGERGLQLSVGADMDYQTAVSSYQCFCKSREEQSDTIGKVRQRSLDL